MRIDLLLDTLCLVKHRSIAKKACDKGLVLLNGIPAKPAKKVVANDIIILTLAGYRIKIKIVMIPTGNVSKKHAIEFYEILSKEEIS